MELVCLDGLLGASPDRNTGNRRNGYGWSVWRSVSIQKTPGAGNQVFISSGWEDHFRSKLASTNIPDPTFRQFYTHSRGASHDSTQTYQVSRWAASGGNPALAHIGDEPGHENANLLRSLYLSLKSHCRIANERRKVGKMSHCAAPMALLSFSILW